MTARVCRETQGALALCSIVIHGSVHRVAFQHTALKTPLAWGREVCPWAASGALELPGGI